MNPYAIPMLMSGVLCMLLAIITWLFRRQERINRIFSFFTLALAVDSFAFFLWFQFGREDDIQTWARSTFTLGWVVPIALIFFFLAFTGYDRRLDERVLGLRVRHFRNGALALIGVLIVLSQFTDLIIAPSANPEGSWDIEFNTLGRIIFPLFALIFLYLIALAWQGYRRAESLPQRRFIRLIVIGALLWIGINYTGALIFPSSSDSLEAFSYLGTSVMAVFFFVAIIHYQSDKVHELNVHLENKVADRTRELQVKNGELERTLATLKEMQEQAIVREKLAALGQIVAGLTHEFNSPLGAIRSMAGTRAKALRKLEAALDDPPATGAGEKTRHLIGIIHNADRVIDEGTTRIDATIRNLKSFARLDEAEWGLADLHEGIESVLALIAHDQLAGIDVVRDFGELPAIPCNPRQLNQVFLNLLTNAGQAIDGEGRITITTRREGQTIRIAIGDTGRGIAPEDLAGIFTPGFATRASRIKARLGLAISQQIIVEHGGRIAVDSTPGTGSCFTVILPVAPDPAPGD